MRRSTDRRKKRRRALVTGGAGFIGSNLCDSLLDDDNEVVAVDDLSAGSRDNLVAAFQSEDFRLVTADVADIVIMDHLISEADVVFHLAATVGVKRAVNEPRLVIENNIKGTDSVLRACGRYGTRVIIASSSEVYGRNSAAPLRESDDRILGPPQVQRWSYSASKGIDEMLAFAFYNEFGVPATVTRFFNTTGPRQSSAYGMVVPTFVRAALAGQPLLVHGDGTQRRCFCHVSDTVRALMLLSEAEDAAGEVYNVGSTEEISMRELADLTIRLVGELCPEAILAEPAIRLVPYAEAYNVAFEDTPRRVPCIDRLHELTGWQHSLGIEHIVREMIAQHGAGA
ncbi:MAG: NAD-dependent epimerase/dehydratase family protein, partial [Gemmatimonadota bacterium]